MKSILILYGFEHSGHHAAALALREAFLAVDKGVRVNVLNYFSHTSRVLEWMSTGAYFRIVRNTPRLWDSIYNNPRSEAKFDRFRKFVRTFAPRGMEEVLERYEPDAIVCTQAFPCGMVNDFKERHDSKLPLHAVLTDYIVPSYWIYPEVDSYFVGCDEARENLLSSGIARDIIFVEGIPIRPCFQYDVKKSEAMRYFQLPVGLPVVMVMGGWSGWGEMGRLAIEIERRMLDCTIVVVTGKNRELFESLMHRRKTGNSAMTVLPYVDRIDVLMGATDLIVGKAGGMTVAEALATGLPFVVFDSLPGHERANAAHLCRHGASVLTHGVEEAVQAVADLIGSPERRCAMSRKARRLARREAATRIAETILEKSHAYVSSV
jgi:processive 1,2-diacylglycerol beta-glucosyltransferase